MQLTLKSFSPEDTGKIANVLAPLLKAGDVLLLQGEVGAGKTDFTRKLIQNRMEFFGLVEDVPSPTYTLLQTYELGDAEYIHVDLYRIAHPDEIFELGLERSFDQAICFVEWPERLGSLVPEDALTVHISMSGEIGRVFKFTWTHPRWNDKIDGLAVLGFGNGV